MQVWHETASGYEYGDFRISRVADSGPHQWRLEVSARHGDARTQWQTASYHRRLATARARAERLEQEQLRHQRILWRLVLGGTILVAAIIAAASAYNLTVFIVSAVGFALAISLCLEAAALRVGDDGLARSWLHLERRILAVMDELERRRTNPALDGEGRVFVSPLPPNPALAHDPGIPAGHADEAIEDDRYPHASPMHVC